MNLQLNVKLLQAMKPDQIPISPPNKQQGLATRISSRTMIQIADTLGTSTGKLCISSIQGFFSFAGSIVFKAFHTALLHLNPDPNAICQILSLLLILPFPSVYASSYQRELLEVFPNLKSVILEGSMCHPESCRFFSNSSKTALPPA